MKNFTKKFQVDELEVLVFETSSELARYASWMSETSLKNFLSDSDKDAGVILATGNSQLEFLEHWTRTSEVDWKRVTLFHMDEYLGISAQHPASFRKYMKDRVECLFQPRKFEYLNGDCLEPIAECDRYEAALRAQIIPLCCLGIGENGHLAFNDPPVANFDDSRWVKVVQLDDLCRMQQVGEGHFPSLDLTPKYALSLSIPGLLNAQQMICVCPESRKAQAVKAALTGPVSTDCPASILRTKSKATLLLDSDSASLLDF